MDKIVLFGLNIFINSYLAFFTAVIFIESVLFLFRIKQGRTASILRMIPIIKLPLDLFFYDFSNWAWAMGLNPLACEKGSRKIVATISFGLNFPQNIISAIQFSTPENLTFTIPDLIYQISIFREFAPFFATAIFLFSLSFLYKKGKGYTEELRYINNLKGISKSSSPDIQNPLILKKLYKGKIRILSSPNECSFVAGLISPTIYIPENLSLSREEYEAVIAHELEHIEKRDTWIRFLLSLISSIFWWIPTKWLQKRIEEGQEVGSDRNCTRYGVNPLDLASAICKSAKTLQRSLLLTDHLARGPTKNRILGLLNNPLVKQKKRGAVFSFLAMGISITIILFGKFWIF